MFATITFFLIIFNVNCILSNYLDVESNYRSPRLERNNIVNKGTWVRNYKDSDKTTGNFLFRGNSIDADNIVHADFNTFSFDGNAGTPFISSYIERNKRSADGKHKKKKYKKEAPLEDIKHQPFSILNILSKANDRRKRRYRKSLNNCSSKGCNPNSVLEENPSLIKSKLLTKLKPASVFNDYPYEIAILLGNNKEAIDEAKNYSSYIISELTKENQTLGFLDDSSNATDRSDAIDDKEANKTVNSITSKRSKNNIESEVIKKVEFNEEINKTQETPRSYIDRDVFAKEDKVWHQNAPIPDINRYKVIGKNDEPKVVRPVTERGLIKVLSMLTNTFKKIMKQHNEIKDIHKKLHSMNEDFVKNVELVSERFQDFETKYTGLVNINQKFMEMEEKLNAREQHFKSRERELTKNLVEFEIQQKKFLTQQRQFYNIQKLMLAQNERINSKQNAIAKTQSEISHRQNNFARILKKAKQVYFDNKHAQQKQTTTVNKIENSSDPKIEDFEVTHTTTMRPQTTDPVKINLFSIPTVTRLENQDHLLLNGKEEQPVDELVYKYYFNNTFIDTLMKNFLSGFLSNGENIDNMKNIKNKRDEVVETSTEKTTILLPVNKTEIQYDETTGKVLTRERRWINHHSKNKLKNRNKGRVADMVVDDEKVGKHKRPREENFVEPDVFKAILEDEPSTTNKVIIEVQKSDPFITMATGFCNGIGQNSSPQMLDWCVEKALRKLQNIDIRMPPPPPTFNIGFNTYKPRKKTTDKEKGTTTTDSTTVSVTSSKARTTSPESSSSSITTAVVTPVTIIAVPTAKDFSKMFFPDNDKLESNLKQFELAADTEGNVYYDGSWHTSDVIKDPNSESDIMPSLDSSSKIDTMDPGDFDTHAMRRALLRRMKYESMLKKMSKL